MNAQCQSEAKCEGNGLKNISYSHANKIRKDFTLTLVLKVRVFVKDLSPGFDQWNSSVTNLVPRVLWPPYRKKRKPWGRCCSHVSWRALEHKHRRCNNFAIFAILVNFFWLEMSKVVCYDVTMGDRSEIQKVWLYFRVRYTMEPKIVRCDMKLR